MPTYKSNTSKKSGSWGRTSRTSRSSTTNSSTWSPNSPQFKPIKNQCQAWIGSYKNVYSQINTSSKTSLSPTVANRFVKLINNGSFVYKFSNPQFTQKFGQTAKDLSPTQATKFLQKKFGAGVKSVARGNANCWLVAATPNVQKGPFKSYNW